MHRGCVVSVVSSAIILAIDLIFSGNADVNIYFQNDLILAGVFVNSLDIRFLCKN